LLTRLIGWRTKLCLLAEPFQRTQPPPGDESIAAFVRRKFGNDLLENLAVPFVSGVYAGDPEKLSLASAFPAVRKLEQEYGSVIRGAMKSRRKDPRPAASLCNFRAGLATLTRAQAEKIGGHAKLGCEVATVQHTAPGEPGRYDVALNSEGAIETLRTNIIVVATPTDQAARLLAAIDPRIALTLDRFEYAPVAQVSAGYRAADISESRLRQGGGFGFLVPRNEGLQSLGTVWNSSLFPGRAPQGMSSFTSFLGGATDLSIRNRTAEEIAATAHRELARVLGIRAAPLAQRVSRWERALPQYNLGHAGIVRALEELRARHPGIFLCGNYLAGPSLGACVEQANKVAEEVAAFYGREMRERTADPSSAVADPG
jgi:oxygen-dependent protoporphyrinogen oxidase